MEETSALEKTGNEENQLDVKGNGNLKRKHGVDGSSDDENDFLGFDLGKISGPAVKQSKRFVLNLMHS